MRERKGRRTETDAAERYKKVEGTVYHRNERGREKGEWGEGEEVMGEKKEVERERVLN